MYQDSFGGQHLTRSNDIFIDATAPRRQLAARANHTVCQSPVTIGS